MELMLEHILQIRHHYIEDINLNGNNNDNQLSHCFGSKCIKHNFITRRFRIDRFQLNFLLKDVSYFYKIPVVIREIQM